jgi:hypothetical protein
MRTLLRKTISAEVIQLPVSCMIGSGPCSAKMSTSSTHFVAVARHMSSRNGSRGESSRRCRWRICMKSSIDHIITCSLSWSKLGGGAIHQRRHRWDREYLQALVKNLPTRASH